MAAKGAATTVAAGDNGNVWIGDGHFAGLTVQPVVVSGATVFVDVANRSAVPTAVVDDYERAAWWLPFVFGEDVAEAVVGIATGTAETRILNVSAGGAETDLVDPLVRFAVGLWLYRWWPLPDRNVPDLSVDDERALQAELGTIAWYTDDVFGDTSVADGFLRDNIDFIEACAIQAGNGRLPAARVRALLRAAIESVSVDDATHVRLTNLEQVLSDRLATADRSSASTATEKALSWLAARLPLGTGKAALTTLGGSPIRGTATVEWGRVPPRTLSSTEDNVTWTYRKSTGDVGGELTVEVAIHPGSRELSDRFFAAVSSTTSPVPDAVIELFRDPPDASRISGVAILEGAGVQGAAESFRVRVFSEQYLAATDGRTAIADTAEKRARIVGIVNSLVLGDTATPGRFADQVDSAAYDVDPAAPWFRLGPRRESS